jgi:hypothetical protein
MRYKSKHNLLRWFIEDHRKLPKSYVKSCEKFFRELAIKRGKLQATSDEPQATSVKQQAIRCNLFTTMLEKKSESEN